MLERLAPDRFYFFVQDRFRPILRGRPRRIVGRQVERIDVGYQVQWDDGSRICLPHRRRYATYVSSSLGERIDAVLRKYQDREVQIRPGDTVVEVGAHIGEFTLGAARTAERIVAFEPDPYARACLELNLAHCHNVQIESLALGEAEGTQDFYISTEGADSSLIEPTNWSAVIRVPTTTLSAYLDKAGIESVDFLKIEAEGAEPEILIGARDRLASIRMVALDGGPERRGQPTFGACGAILSDAGFRCWRRGDMLFAAR